GSYSSITPSSPPTSKPSWPTSAERPPLPGGTADRIPAAVLRGVSRLSAEERQHGEHARGGRSPDRAELCYRLRLPRRRRHEYIIGIFPTRRVLWQHVPHRR